MKKLYLVDASNMFFRAFYAIRHLTNSKGMPTNALYGFLSMTIKLLKEKNPDYLAYCFDSKEPSFRLNLYSEYKANRTEMPEELVQQMPFFSKLVEALGIPHFHQSGVEADDIIGTLTTLAQKNDVQVVIVSGDKDFAQLINAQVSMYDTMKDVIYDVPGVLEKWGVHPDQFIDYLAMVGDSSDNIPGIPGVGPKTALKILNQFESLDSVYKNIEDLKPDKLREKVRESKEMALLSRELVTIKKDVPVDSSLEHLKMKPIQREVLEKILSELDFKSFERKILESVEGGPSQLKQEESSQPSLTRESEPDSVDMGEPLDSKSLSQIFQKGQEVWAISDNRGFYLSDGKKAYALQGSLQEYSQGLDQLDLGWKGYDLKGLFKQINLKRPRACWDHQIASYILGEYDNDSYLELVEYYCDISLSDFPTPQELLETNLKLEQALRERLESHNGLSIYQNLELPLISILYEMETLGIKLDTQILKRQSEELQKDIKRVEEAIFEMSGEVFNVASPKQLSRILFEKLGLTPIKKNKTGYSTGSDVLLKLEDVHPIARLVIEYREFMKLKSTYVDALPLLVSPETQRVHTVFHQTVTSTGRLSSSNPNLQNIPIRTERGNAVRKAFIAETGYELVSADYSQIELRVLAHVTEDRGLIQAFENDLDIHAATASEIFAISLKDVTPDHRRIAKAVNFGLAYGMGPHGLAENLKISRSEASSIIQKYFTKFPGVKKYMSDCVELAKEQGFVETIFGRRRYAEELKSKNPMIRNAGERAVINAPMQGSAADIVKKAMIDIARLNKYRMLLQVHDELIFEIPKESLELATLEIKNLMESATQLKVPLKVNVAHGPSWYEAH